VARPDIHLDRWHQQQRRREFASRASRITTQHLAKMREEGIVDFRRDSQTLWYRVCAPRIEILLGQLQRLYCSD
jgi:ArsR family transcriptional regulator